MSFRSVESDDIDVFSTSTCSGQHPDSTVGQSGSTGSGGNRQKILQSSPSLADEGPLFKALFLSDVVPKQEDDNKVENQDCGNSLDGIEWPADLMSLPSGNPQLNMAPVKSLAPTMSGNCLLKGWSSSAGGRKGPLSPRSFGSGDDKLTKEEDEFTDAYDSVDFDLTSSRQNTEFDQKSPRSPGTSTRLPLIEHSAETSSSDCESLLNINRSCFEAAVKEHYGKQKKTTSQYVAKMRKSKHHHSSSTQAYDKQHRSCQSPPSSVPSEKNSERQQELVQKLKLELQKQKAQKEVADSCVTSHLYIESRTTSADNKGTTLMKTMATFSTPYLPSSPPSSSVLSPSLSDEQRSPKSTKSDVDLKKHRYNQTALALQQSGLMKITIKTAELLRKSRTLQQELSKLRRETSLFVQAVLSNPENKHLRDLYLPQQSNENTS